MSELGLNVVPLIGRFIYEGDKEDLKTRVESVCEGPDIVDPTHIREGVVVRIENGNSFWAMKHKNFEFKVLEDIIKDAGLEDIEESS